MVAKRCDLAARPIGRTATACVSGYRGSDIGEGLAWCRSLQKRQASRRPRRILRTIVILEPEGLLSLLSVNDHDHTIHRELQQSW